jgi:hypothetical protein
MPPRGPESVVAKFLRDALAGNVRDWFILARAGGTL